MKTTITTLFLVFFCLCAKAQKKVSFEGEVRSPQNVAVQFANVMALDTAKNTILAFAVTNEKGLFKLALQKDKPYKIKISYVGFKAFERVIKGMDTSDSPILIKLEDAPKDIAGVEVVQELPVSISGDTITYKTDAFVDETERKLGDVLEKLPGFEVDENGQVKVQGKQVSKVLVEGKEFFEGDTKMATQNLPANAIDKVQVLENYNDVGALRGLDNNEQLALNIKLKEDKKNMVFGDLSAGVGPEDRYLGHANLFYYSPKANINLIADANNIGSQTFSPRDFFRFGGGMTNISRRSGSSFQVRADDIGVPMLGPKNAAELESRVGALNYNFKPNNKWSHSGFLIGAFSDNRLASISQRTYIRQSGDNQELLTSETRMENTSGLFKYTGRYTPSEQLQVIYSAFAKGTDMTNTNNRQSEFTNFNNDIGAINNRQPVSIDQQLRVFYSPNAQDVFSAEVTYEYKNQDLLYDLSTTERPFASLIPVGDATVFNLLQDKVVTTHKQASAFNYYRILNKTNHINFKIGNSYNRQDLSSALSQVTGQGEIDFTDPDLNNDVDFTFSDVFAGVTYKTKLNQFTLSPGLNVHRYSFSNRQLGTEEKTEKTLVLPQFYAKYSIRSGHSLSVRYGANAEFTDIQNVAAGLVVENYNRLFSGNRNLQNSWYHQVSLSYMNFDMFNFLSIFGGLQYRRRFEGITNATTFRGLERVDSPLNIGVANEDLTGNLSFDKQFDYFRINLSAQLSERRSNNLVNDLANENRSFLQNYRATFETTFFKKLNWEVGYSKIFNEYSAAGIMNTFETDRPFTKMKLRFLKGFRLDVDYEYNNYTGSTGVDQSFDLMNAELSYHKKKSKWEFKLEGLNLLNTTSIRRDSFNENLISTFENFIQQRYYLLTVKYDL